MIPYSHTHTHLASLQYCNTIYHNIYAIHSLSQILLYVTSQTIWYISKMHMFSCIHIHIYMHVYRISYTLSFCLVDQSVLIKRTSVPRYTRGYRKWEDRRITDCVYKNSPLILVYYWWLGRLLRLLYVSHKNLIKYGYVFYCMMLLSYVLYHLH